MTFDLSEEDTVSWFCCSLIGWIIWKRRGKIFVEFGWTVKKQKRCFHFSFTQIWCQMDWSMKRAKLHQEKLWSSTLFFCATESITANWTFYSFIIISDIRVQMMLINPSFSNLNKTTEYGPSGIRESLQTQTWRKNTACIRDLLLITCFNTATANDFLLTGKNNQKLRKVKVYIPNLVLALNLTNTTLTQWADIIFNTLFIKQIIKIDLAFSNTYLQYSTEFRAITAVSG